MNKTIRRYDIAEYSAKGIAAIEKMMATQKPGQTVKGTKQEVCMAIKAKLKEAEKAGYTPQQIAEALKTGDVFGILPKTISEVLEGTRKAAPKRKKASTAATEKKVETAQESTPVATSSSRRNENRIIGDVA